MIPKEICDQQQQHYQRLNNEKFAEQQSDKSRNLLSVIQSSVEILMRHGCKFSQDRILGHLNKILAANQSLANFLGEDNEAIRGKKIILFYKKDKQTYDPDRRR